MVFCASCVSCCVVGVRGRVGLCCFSCVCCFGSVAYVLCVCSVGIARDRGDQPEASSSRHFRGEESRYTIAEPVLVSNCFNKYFVLNMRHAVRIIVQMMI